MHKPFLILLDGMTGAGKTTTTHLLMKESPRTAMVGMDKIRKFVSDFERGERDNAIAKDIVFIMAQKYLELGLSVIVDQPFRYQDEIEQYVNLAKENSVACYKFQLFTSPDIAYARVMERQKGSIDPVPEDMIRRNISFFEKKDDAGFICIDTSVLPKEGAFEVIMKELRHIDIHR